MFKSLKTVLNEEWRASSQIYINFWIVISGLIDMRLGGLGMD